MSVTDRERDGIPRFSAPWSAARALTIATLLYAPTPTVRADQIVIDAESIAPVEVITFEGAAVKFRRPEGRIQSAWIDEIGLIIIDRGGFFDDFNQAERFRQSGEYERAVTRYKRALRSADGHWQDLVAARAATASDRAGQLDNAVQYWIVLLRGAHGGVAAAARTLPGSIPDSFNGRVERALHFIDSALAAEPREAERALLTLLRFAILAQIGDDRSTQAALDAAAVEIPEPAWTEPVFRIQIEAFRRMPQQGAENRLAALVDQALRSAPDALLPELLLMKGAALERAAQSRGDLLRAAWPYLRVVIHFPDHALTPRALLNVAGVLERAELPDKALAVLQESLGHARAGDELRNEARRRADSLRNKLNHAPSVP
jgi:tetratricopeptide (TPR) repeat protein